MNNTITIKFCSEEAKKMFNDWWFHTDKTLELHEYYECREPLKANVSSNRHSISVNLVDYPTQETHTINGYEVPLPLTEFDIDRDYWIIELSQPNFAYRVLGDAIRLHKRVINRGLVFSTKEAAIQNAKAMLGIDPKGEE